MAARASSGLAAVAAGIGIAALLPVVVPSLAVLVTLILAKGIVVLGIVILLLTLLKTGASSSRMREVMTQNLAPLIDQAPAALPAELKQIQARLLPILASISGKEPAKPWWQRIF